MSGRGEFTVRVKEELAALRHAPAERRARWPPCSASPPPSTSAARWAPLHLSWPPSGGGDPAAPWLLHTGYGVRPDVRLARPGPWPCDPATSWSWPGLGRAGADRQRRPRRRRPAQLGLPGGLVRAGGGRPLRQGAFLGRGSVSALTRAPHLEIGAPEERTAGDLAAILARLGLPARTGCAAPTSTGWWSRAARRSAGPCWSWGPRPPTWPGRTAASGGRCGARRSGWPTPTTPTCAAAWPRPWPRWPRSAGRGPAGLDGLPGDLAEIAVLRLAHPDASLAEPGHARPAALQGAVCWRVSEDRGADGTPFGSEE